MRNYRGLPSVVSFYNERFYDSQLIATISEEDSREAVILRQFQEILPCNKNESFGLHFVDVREGTSQRIQGKKSWMNSEEAFAVIFF